MKYLMTLALVLSVLTAQAQWNFKIAYDDAYFNPSKINAITKDYNQNNANAFSNFKRVVHLTGIEMGARFRNDFIALEGSWTTRFTTKEQINWLDATKNDRKKQTFSINNQTFNGGVTLLLGKLGIGASYDLNYFNMSKKFIGQARKSNIYDKSLRYNSATIFAQYEMKMTNVMHFAIRPYIQMPLGGAKLNTLEFRNAISPKSDLTFADGFGQDLTFIGLKFIFFNGEQLNDN
jgi:hypothetical protein